MNQSERNENCTILTLKRPQNEILSSRNLRKFFQEETHLKPKKVILNLDEVDYIDSSMLGSIIFLLTELNSYGGILVICNISPSIKTLFEITRMDTSLNIQNSLEEALNF